jgi:hypothetical protein
VKFNALVVFDAFRCISSWKAETERNAVFLAKRQLVGLVIEMRHAPPRTKF